MKSWRGVLMMMMIVLRKVRKIIVLKEVNNRNIAKTLIKTLKDMGYFLTNYKTP